MHAASSPRSSGRARRTSSPYESERKRARLERLSPDAVPRKPADRDRGWERDSYDSHRGSYSKPSYPHRPKYEGGMQNGSPYGSRPSPALQPPLPNTSKSRRLYIGNVPYHVGLTDIALTQFFSALYVAGFGPNRPGEPLPVISFWLHADGKFGFMELRGEQEAVNMMQFNGVFLHNRPLRVNRPSDYRPEVHNPSGMNLVPDSVNVRAVMELCEKLGGIAAAPAQLAAIAASQPKEEHRVPSFAHSKPIRPDVIAKAEHDPIPPMEPTSASQHAGSTQAGPTHELRSAVTEKPVADESAVRSEPMGKIIPSTTESMEQSREYTVISLENLVTDEDLDGDDEDYEDLVADVQAECENYGSVEEVNIPKSGTWKRTAFIQFKESLEAKKAVDALKKRVFDKRQIAAIGLPDCQTAAAAAARSGTRSNEMHD
ncbi:RNA recognition motif [Gracilaria domingensis]|nr:RNA recognition motif [Gracilaria domingensis]